MQILREYRHRGLRREFFEQLFHPLRLAVVLAQHHRFQIVGQLPQFNDGVRRIFGKRRQQSQRQLDGRLRCRARRVLIDLEHRVALGGELLDDLGAREQATGVDRSIHVASTLFVQFNHLRQDRHCVVWQIPTQRFVGVMQFQRFGRGAGDLDRLQLPIRGERVQVDLVDRFDLVAEQVEASRGSARGEDVHDPAADRELARGFDRLYPGVAGLMQPIDERRQVERVSGLDDAHQMIEL